MIKYRCGLVNIDSTMCANSHNDYISDHFTQHFYFTCICLMNVTISFCIEATGGRSGRCLACGTKSYKLNGVEV